MYLTKQQAIEEHRKMWNWIADETLKRKYKVQKFEYFKEHEDEYGYAPNFCWCCMYAERKPCLFSICVNCPIKWNENNGKCVDIDTSYISWIQTADSFYKEAAYYARKIAELPEKEDD